MSCCFNLALSANEDTCLSRMHHLSAGSCSPLGGGDSSMSLCRMQILSRKVWRQQVVQALSHTKPREVHLLTLSQIWAAPLLHVQKLSFMVGWHGMGGGLGDKLGLICVHKFQHLLENRWMTAKNIPSRKKIFPCYFLALLFPFLPHLSVWKILWPSFQFRDLEPRGVLYVIMIQIGLLLTKRAAKTKVLVGQWALFILPDADRQANYVLSAILE